MSGWLTGLESAFAVKLAFCLLLGSLIGVERELRNKPAGISTHCFVMAGACLFTFISTVADPGSPARIAAQVVSGVGFLGAGMILKSESNTIKNLTTAAAIWFAAAIGMAVGIGWYAIAAIATVYAVIVPRIPHIKRWRESQNGRIEFHARRSAEAQAIVALCNRWAKPAVSAFAHQLTSAR